MHRSPPTSFDAPGELRRTAMTLFHALESIAVDTDPIVDLDQPDVLTHNPEATLPHLITMGKLSTQRLHRLGGAESPSDWDEVLVLLSVLDVIVRRLLDQSLPGAAHMRRLSDAHGLVRVVAMETERQHGPYG